MDIMNSSPLPVFFRKEPRVCKERYQASEKLGIKMKIVGNEVACQMKKVFMGLHILLATVRTKFTGYFRTTIQAVGFGAVLLMTHGAAGLLL